MDKKSKSASEYIGYEYKEITVASTRVSMYLDGYESFGWESDDKFTHTATMDKITLHLRRDRKIINKMELTRLERNFEADMEEIEQLEKSKLSKPQIVALSIGIIGTAFMAGSVFAITAEPPIIWLCVLLAIHGIIGWIFPYYIYKKLMKKRIEAVSPFIDEKYNEIYELCQKGNELIN